MLRTALLLAAPLALAAPPAAPSPAASAFLERHCVECHDADMKKGGLDLTTLAFRPEDRQSSKTWQRMIERVREGEMPPSKKPRPPAAAAAGFVADVHAPLLAADAADVARQGRVHVRRLTRVEYEYAVHDLLGIDIPLDDFLPEDPVTHGFQTVAEGQQLSHHQLGRYLDMADVALDEAFTRALEGDRPFVRTLVPDDLDHNGRGNNRAPEHRRRDDLSISWNMSLQFYGRMHATVVPEAGWYRVTLKSVRAINPREDGTVWGTLRSGHCESNAPILYMMGLVEATAQPRDMTFEGWIQKGHRLELRPNDFTLRRPPAGATGGNVSYVGRDLEASGFPGIANKGIVIERFHPNADAPEVARRLFAGRKVEELRKDPAGTLPSLIADFAGRAFRRPVGAAEAAPFAELALKSVREGESVEIALKSAYHAILCSPRFLTLVEQPGRLDDYAVASRLSFALWLSGPDEALLQAARAGRLRDPAEIERQALRLLQDRKAERFISSFTDQWLKLSQIDFTSPDPRQFPTFDPVLQESMLQEARAFVRETLSKDLPVTHLLDSGFAFLNGRLTRHYGLKVPLKAGGGLQKIELPAGARTDRGGVIGLGAVLKVTADGTSTSPVVRGVFVNERLLGVHVPPPPPNVPAIGEPDVRGATSIRDRLEKHRSGESCMSCHRVIDMPGFALETLDPVGLSRSRYGLGRGVKIDPSGTTPDGEAFAGLAEWKRLQLAHAGRLARGFAGNFLTYATGAAPRLSDQAALDAVTDRAAARGHGMRSILLASLASPVFLNK
ncbi:MAG: DUF1592 domain-containing protein [Opitutales bacterium]